MLTRSQVARRLGKSIATVRRMEGFDLNPWTDERGVNRFDADEVDAVAKSAGHRAPQRLDLPAARGRSGTSNANPDRTSTVDDVRGLVIAHAREIDRERATAQAHAQAVQALRGQNETIRADLRACIVLVLQLVEPGQRPSLRDRALDALQAIVKRSA